MAKKVSNIFVGIGILLLAIVYLKSNNSLFFIVCNILLIFTSRIINKDGGIINNGKR